MTITFPKMFVILEKWHFENFENSAFLKMGNHEPFWINFLYILFSNFIFQIELKHMVSHFQKNWIFKIFKMSFL